MKYGADDLDTIAWDKVAHEHLAIAQDIFADLYSGSYTPAGRETRAAMAQAHSLQALALMYGWSR